MTWGEPRQELAVTSPDSRERFLARRDLPALAKRLREARLCLSKLWCYCHTLPIW